MITPHDRIHSNRLGHARVSPVAVAVAAADPIDPYDHTATRAQCPYSSATARRDHNRIGERTTFGYRLQYRANGFGRFATD